MTRLKKITLILGLPLMLLTACGEVEDTRPGQPVKQRQQAFKQLLRSFEPMGTMLKDNRYDADKFIAMAEQFKADLEGPWAHFGPDTHYPPSKSKPEIWQKPEEFAKARARFLTEAEALISAAQQRDKNLLASRHQAVYETCRDCHNAFRER